MNYIIIFISLFILSILYLKIAEKFNIIDKPNHRSSHTVTTIRGGGILFFLSILIYFFVSGFEYPYLILGVSIISIISFIDDILSLSSSLRLPFQFLAISLSLYELGYEISDGFYVIPLVIIGIGFINVYNFMDGINGITGFYSIASIIGLLLINQNESLLDNNLLIYVLISVLIFGFYNFRTKARMFAGDVGSVSIALFLFFVEFFLFKELRSPLILLLVGVYGVDGILTLIYRKSIGEKLTEAHRDHIYQKMVHYLKIPQLKVSLGYALLQLILNFVVYFCYQLEIKYQILLFLVIIIFLMWLYYYYYSIVENVKKEIEKK